MESKRSKGRIIWLDVCRTLALVLISLNHAVNRAYQVYENQAEEFYSIPLGSTVFKTVSLVCSHIGVPLFLMITGALILSKSFEDKKDFQRFYRHNFLGLLITSEIWYFIMYWGIAVFYDHSVRGNLPGAIAGCIKTMLFIDQVTMGSMWYMPVILCLYLILPFVSVLVKRFPIKAFAVPAILVYFSSMVMPFASELSVIAGGNEIAFALKSSNVFSFYLLYVLAGYWIYTGLLDKISSFTVIAAGAGLLFVSCILQFLLFKSPADYAATYDFPLFLPLGMCVFEIMRRFGGRVWESSRNIFIYLSEISFGVYFVHVCIMTFMEKFFDFSNWSKIAACLFFEVISVGMSIGLIWLLSHSRILKKYMFMIKDQKVPESIR